LGFRAQIDIANGTVLLNGTVGNLTTYTIPATGIWYIAYSLSIYPSNATNIGTFQTYIQNNAGGTFYGTSSNTGTQLYIANVAFFMANTGSAILSLTLNTVIAVKYLISGVTSTVNESNIIFVRIA
jgi:hypothetical protein